MYEVQMWARTLSTSLPTFRDKISRKKSYFGFKMMGVRSKCRKIGYSHINMDELQYPLKKSPQCGFESFFHTFLRISALYALLCALSSWYCILRVSRCCWTRSTIILVPNSFLRALSHKKSASFAKNYPKFGVDFGDFLAKHVDFL